MNVIPSNTNAKVLEPVYSADLKTVVNYSAIPVIGWAVSDSGHVNPITCMGQPEGHFMVKFVDESVDFEGFVYIPPILETLSPWVRNEDIKGFALEGVSKSRIIEKFQQLLESA